MIEGERTAPEPSEGSPARILVVDDDPVVCEHFGDIIRSCSRMQLSGSARNLREARKLIVDCPDLVLLDLGLPDGSGLSIIGEIKKVAGAFVLVVTSFGDRETVVAALSAGADGYLLKDSDNVTVLSGIEATLAGGAPLSPSAAVYLLDSLRGPSSQTGKSSEHSGLTVREVELLKLFARGLSYKEAAKELEISPLTVGNYVKSIYRKLAVNSRGEAVYTAMKSGQLKV